MFVSVSQLVAPRRAAGPGAAAGGRAVSDVASVVAGLRKVARGKEGMEATAEGDLQF